MLENVRELLAKQLRINAASITAASRIKEDLGADSLDVMQILMTIEEENGIIIPDEELVELSTVGDIVEYLESQGK